MILGICVLGSSPGRLVAILSGNFLGVIVRKYHLNIYRWWFQIFCMFTPTWGDDPI